MESLSQTASNKIRTYGFKKTSYDEVFGGPPKTFSPRVEDYGEIFGGFRSSSAIPVLDLPAVVDDDAEVFFDVRGSKFDYSEIFGGFDFDFPCVELFDRVIGGDELSGKGWIPAEIESRSENSATSAHSGKSQSSTNGVNHPSFDGIEHEATETNKNDLPYETHLTQAPFHPQFTFLIDENSSPHMMEDINVPTQGTDDINLSTDFIERDTGSKHLRKTMSHPAKNTSDFHTLGKDIDSVRIYSQNGSYHDATFITVAEINLRTHPSQVPPPSRPPPIRKGNAGELDSALKVTKNNAFEKITGDSSPPFFDVEVDASSSAAASAAAMKEAMEQAQAKLRSAKVMGRKIKSDKLGSMVDIKDKKGNISKTIDEYNNLNDMRLCDTNEGDFFNWVENSTPKRGKELCSSPESYKTEVVGEWKEANDFFELVETDKLRNTSDQCQPSSNGKMQIENIKPQVCNRKEKKIDMEASEQQDRNSKKLNPARAAWELEENKKELKISEETQMQKEHEKEINVAYEQRDTKGYDFVINVLPEENYVEFKETVKRKETFQREKYKNQLRQAFGLEETEEKSKQGLQKDEIDKRLKEAYEKEQIEKKQKEALEENERILKASRDQEENEKRLKKDFERNENEKKQKEALERVEYENNLKEAHERKENEKRLKEAREKEDYENKLKEALERKEKEKRLKEALEKEENEKRLNEALEKEANEKKENEKRLNEKRLNEALEKEANEKKENEKRLNEALEMEANERKENEKRLNEALEKEANEKKQREAIENEEYEKKRKEALNKGEIEKGGSKACKRENNKNRLEEAQKRQKNEKMIGEVGQEGAGAKSRHNSTWEDGKKNIHDSVREVKMHQDNEGTEIDNNEKIPKTVHKDEGTFEGEVNIESVQEIPAEELSEKIIMESKDGDNVVEPVEKKSVPADDRFVASSVMKGDAVRSVHLDDCVNKSGQTGKKKIQECEPSFYPENMEEKITHEWVEKRKNVGQDQMVFDQGEKKDKLRTTHMISEGIENGKHMADEKRSTKRSAHHVNTNKSTELKEKNVHEEAKFEMRVKEERAKKEKEAEQDRLRKLEEEREREIEREKDRMDVERTTLEGRERANTESRERTAVERESAEARQRALMDARERLEEACAEAWEKASMETRIKAERAAVERATAVARERAMESCTSGSRHPYPSTYTGKCEGIEVESAQRCKARLERHQRTTERAAKALVEMNTRDFLAQREQAERHRFAESVDADVKRWSSGKERNLRALLSTLQYILGPGSGWHPVPLTEIITAAAVKKAYRKATLCVHPDKLQQRGASIRQKYICEKVFDLLKEAWNRFNSEER